MSHRGRRSLVIGVAESVAVCYSHAAVRKSFICSESMSLRAMTRRICLFVLATAVGVLGIGVVAAKADEKNANLNETLRSVLKCRRQDEFAFVESVVEKVNQGDLPRDLVISMMQWAKDRRPEFPFPYFKEGIKRRAAKIGVTL